MADLPEFATYDAGVYQIEVTDAVVGGVDGKSNAAAKALANRTKYLKEHVDALEGSSMLSKSVAGGVDVTLTAAEARNRILEFHGILTANISVIVPASPTRDWIVINETIGDFVLTIKTPAGTGIPVAQSSSAHVYTDGINVYYDAPIVPQAEAEAGIGTILRGWNALRVRQAALAALNGALSKSVAGAVDVTLTASEAASTLITFTGAITANVNVIFPASPGSWILKNDTTGNFILSAKTAAGSSVELNGGSSVHAYCDGVGIYRSETVQPVIRVVGVASATFPSPPVDVCDLYKITALATAATITAPTSYTHSIAEEQPLMIRIKDNGTARALTWDAIYRPIEVTLPTTTVAGKTLYIGMFYNLTDTKWDVVAVKQEL